MDYTHSAGDSVCLLGLSELPRAMMAMPIAFYLANGDYCVVAVQGLLPGINSFITADGKWKGHYVPATYRGHPFVLAKNTKKEGETVLCIDTESGLVFDDDTEDPFFDEDLKLSQPLTEAVEFLSNLSAAKQESIRVCKTLSEYGLLKPWEIRFQPEGEAIQQMDGLFCIDEAVLDGLSGDAYAALRLAGAIPVIYCQMLSMQRISSLILLQEEKSKAGPLQHSSELGFAGVSEDGNISFENF